MIKRLYIRLREIKWNIRTFLRALPIVWNFWDFLVIRKHMGPRTAYLWGGGMIHLRNYHDVQILLEVFENSYDIREPHPTVADIGANIGIFSVFYARKFPDAHIDAYEPEPNNFRLLKKNTLPYPNITCHNVAVGAAEGEMELFLATKNLGRHSRHQSWVRREHHITVPVTTLKKTYDLIKLDVEGSEYEILKNVPRCRKMVMELHEVDGEDSKGLLAQLAIHFRVTDLGGHVYSCEAR